MFEKMTGWLETDIGKISKNFIIVEQVVFQLHKKIETFKTDITSRFNKKSKKTTMMFGNMTLYNLEKSQKVKVGVKG